jgi:hypothetical protein
MKRGHIVPVFEAEPLQGIGIEQLLEEVARLFPSPLDREWKDAEGRAGHRPGPRRRRWWPRSGVRSTIPSWAS